MSPSTFFSSAVEATFRLHRPEIHRYIRGLVRGRAEAEDLTQETFLRAHRQIDALEDPGAMRGWLFRIATNVCTDFLREAARRRKLEGSPGEGAERNEPTVADEGPSPGELLDRASMNACGEEFLASLPRGYRRVLVLHDLVGLTSVEIARLLRSTPGAVKIRLHRARESFRAALEAGCDFHRDDRGALVGAPKPRKR
jgi:RNA polymerase sigma-70 factor, ECF subfamily